MVLGEYQPVPVNEAGDLVEPREPSIRIWAVGIVLCLVGVCSTLVYGAGLLVEDAKVVPRAVKVSKLTDSMPTLPLATSQLHSVQQMVHAKAMQEALGLFCMKQQGEEDEGKTEDEPKSMIGNMVRTACSRFNSELSQWVGADVMEVVSGMMDGVVNDVTRVLDDPWIHIIVQLWPSIARALSDSFGHNQFEIDFMNYSIFPIPTTADKVSLTRCKVNNITILEHTTTTVLVHAWVTGDPDMYIHANTTTPLLPKARVVMSSINVSATVLLDLSDISKVLLSFVSPPVINGDFKLKLYRVGVHMPFGNQILNNVLSAVGSFLTEHDTSDPFEIELMSHETKVFVHLLSEITEKWWNSVTLV